jgi:enoyl-CoA hydratase/carnithine racemase
VPLLEALPRALAEAEARGARAAVLRGRGDLWSAGYDIDAIPAELFAADPTAVAAHPFTLCMQAVADAAIPTLAALHGHAYGGALELAAACDLRLAHAGMRCGLTPARLGLVYPRAGIERFLRLIGPAPLRRLLFAAETIDATEAERIGLVHRAIPDESFDTEVEALAARLAAGAPLAVQGMKRVLRLLEAAFPVDEAAAVEIRALQQQAYASEDFREGRTAFAARRAARFRGR